MSALRAISLQPPFGWVVASGACGIASLDTDTEHRGEVALFMGGPWRLRDDRNREIRRAVGCTCNTSLVAPGARDCPYHADSGGVAGQIADSCGAIIATAQLVDVHPDQGCCGIWAERGFHYVLEDARRLSPRVACSGRQAGCWFVIDEIERRVRHAQRQPAMAGAVDPF